VSNQEDLVTLRLNSEDPRAYEAFSRSILEEAQMLGTTLQQEVAAVLVWEGEPRSGSDSTQAFHEEARKRGLQVLQIRTIRTAGAI